MSADITAHNEQYARPIQSLILGFEADQLGEDEVIELFQRLVDTGLAWQLQGYYGRTAAALIDTGLVTQ